MKRILLIGSLLLMLLLAGCGADKISGESVRSTTGSLTITSSARGVAIGRADVYLDGVYKGKTSMTIKNLPPGTYEVRLEKEGYLPNTVKVKITAGRRTNLIVALTPVPKR